MDIEKIYRYIVTNFEGPRFEDIVLDKEDSMKFEKNTDEREKIRKDLNDKDYNKLIEMLSKNFMEQIVKGNRKIKFTKHDLEHILILYQDLIEDIADEELSEMQITKAHFERVKELIGLLGKEDCHSSHDHEKTISYSPTFVLDVLGIDEEKVQGKVLEIGCTKSADLVKYLRSKNIEAYGLDMDVEENEFLEKEDWLEKDFGSMEYDMILSNLAFTKHFLQNHLSDEGEYMEYATTFMRILEGLKIGGSFYYAPSVEFIEELLPEEKFEVINEFIDEENMRTIIKRLK